MFVASPPCEGCQWLSSGQLSDQQSSPWLCSLVNQTETILKAQETFAGVLSWLADWHVTIFFLNLLRCACMCIYIYIINKQYTHIYYVNKMILYICIHTSGGPLSALTCCVNVRLLSAIKKISPLIYSQSWVGSWVYTTQAMMTFTLIF